LLSVGASAWFAGHRPLKHSPAEPRLALKADGLLALHKAEHFNKGCHRISKILLFKENVQQRRAVWHIGVHIGKTEQCYR
jgi:hypothetical protein